MAATRRSDPKLSIQDLKQALGKGEPAPIYILAGPEAVLRDQALEALKSRLIEPEFEAFNFRVTDPPGLAGSGVAEEMSLLPMGSGRRMLVVNPADGLLKDQLASLAEYAADPSGTGCLVLVAGQVKEGLRKAAAGAVIVDCSSPYEDRLPQILSGRARELGVKLDREAADYLAALCGRDLTRASAELGKAAEQAGPGGRVSREMVEALAGGGAASDIFKIGAALARSDAVEAVRATRRFLEVADHAEPRVLYELGMHLRRLLAARGNMASGMRPQEAARAAGIFWKDAEAFAGTLRDWPEERIRRAFRKLLAADRRVKTGVQDPKAAIEGYIWETMGSGRRSGRAAGR